jgi:hypothetical protein
MGPCEFDPGHMLMLRERPLEDVSLKRSSPSFKLPSFAVGEVLVLCTPGGQLDPVQRWSE